MSKKSNVLIYWGMVAGFVLALAAVAAPSMFAQKQRKPGVYATLQTDQGTIVCELFEKEAPETVKNFIGLAEGTKEYKDPKSGAMKKGHYYDGTVFHRVREPALQKQKHGEKLRPQQTHRGGEGLPQNRQARFEMEQCAAKNHG